MTKQETQPETTDEKNLIRLQPEGESPKALYDKFIKGNTGIEEYRNVGVSLDSRKSPLSLSVVLYSIAPRPVKGSNVVKVDPKSFVAERVPLFDALVKICYKHRQAHNTLRNTIKSVLRFIDYLNINDLPMPLMPEDSRYAYMQYTTHLKGLIIHGLSQVTASTYQAATRRLLSTLFQDKKIQDNIFKRIRNISKSSGNHSNPTAVREEEAAYAISYYYHFFHQVSDFLLKGLPFIHVISLNDKRALLTPYGKNNVLHEEFKHSTQTPWIYFLLDEARLRTKDEAVALLPKLVKWEEMSKNQKKNKRSNISIKILNYQQQIEAANANLQCSERIVLAELALRAFYMFFSAVTGQTDSTLAKIEWGEDDTFKVEKNSYRMVSLKPRANYKEIEFTIHRLGVYALRKFLKLRRYMLQGSKCDRLFFENHGSATTTVGPLSTGNFGNDSLRKHQAIDPFLPNVGPKKLRNLKNKLILRQTGGNLWLAAAMLGHTPKVNAEHYQRETQEKIDGELENFATAMVRTLKEGTHVKTKSSPQSHCDSFEQPEAFIEGQELDCSNIFSCFSCKRYGVHPEREDIHKLMSLLCIIKRINTGRAFDAAQFNEVLLPVEKMIKKIFKVMAKKHGAGELINEIQTQVFTKGILHHYWELRLRHLYQLGAL